ncbi:MAG: FAD-binding oxidoreductase [Desulfobacter sp.]
MNQGFESKSYWLSSMPYTPNPSLNGDITVDVGIVGGGFTGLSTAYHLKKENPDMRVAILDSEVVGFGASGRNGGFNMTLFGLTMPITAMRFGREKTRQAHFYMEEAVDYLHALIQKHDIACDYEHNGFLRVATSEKYKRRIMDEVEFAHKLGLEGISWLNESQVREEVGSPMYLGGWWEPRCGILNPAKLSWAWKDIVTALGVSVYENTAVTEISKQTGHVALQTENGRVKADKIVLATNAYSHLIPDIKRKQMPGWTYIVLTEPLSEDQLSQIGWANRQGVEDARNMIHYYRLTADNRLLMGGRDVGFAYGKNMDLDRNERIFAKLEADVRQIFPCLKSVSFTHRWGGPVSITTDMVPVIGFIGDKNIAYSIGCIGHGVSMTHLNGKTVSELVLGEETDLTDMFFVNRRILPWPPDPVKFIAAHMIRGCMHLGDLIHDPKPAA